jgi:ATP-dependent DNA helicase RecG
MTLKLPININDLLHQRLHTEALGRRMNIIGGPTEKSFPKNIGLLFFNEHPEKFFPATQIDVVYFPDGAGGDQFEEKEFRGPLGHIARDTVDYIKRNYLKETIVKHPDRAEAERFWNYPLAAVEEAVVNAVYHRSYKIREPIEIRITLEELVVLSFPGPDHSIRLEDLQAGRAVSRRYRNRRIGEFLKELDLTEGRSTGIPKILRVMKANGSPTPIFETDENRTYFLIRLPIHSKFINAEQRIKSTPEVTPEVERLLAVLKGEMTRTELMMALGLKDEKHFREHYLKTAINQGIIEMTIPDKPRSRFQKYRIALGWK